MKKLITGAVLFSLLLTCGAQAAEAKDIGVTLDGKTIAFDTAPCLDNGRVLVPMRGILESLGYSVEWQNDTKSVLAQKGETSILMPLGSKQVTVSGKSVTVDAPAKLVSGRTLVPLRFLAEYSGAEVVWDGTTQTVNITSKQEPEVPAEKTIRDSLVFIETGIKNKDATGVVLSEDGLIATSYNLIKESAYLNLTFNYGRAYHGDITIVGMDAEKDIVLLQLDQEDLYPIKTSTKYKKDDPVFLLNIKPDGRYGTLNGKILGYVDEAIEINASAGGGNAVFNEKNEVIGISTFDVAGSWGRAVIPISDVKAIRQNLSMSVEDLKAHVYKPSAPRNLDYTDKGNYYTISWTPINKAENYIVSVTRYADTTCPYLPPKETTEHEVRRWLSSGSGYVTFFNDHTHAEVKVKAIVDGKETGWSKTLKVYN